MHMIATAVFDRHALASVRGTKKIIRKLDAIQPDVVHIHNLHGYYLNYSMLMKYLSQTKFKVIYTLHDCWCLTGHCIYYSDVGCKRWITSCHHCVQKRTYPISLIADRSAKNHEEKKSLFATLPGAIITTPSAWMCSQLTQSHLRHHQIHVISNALELDKFCPGESAFRKKHGLEDKFIIFGVASIWERRKGLEYLVEMDKLLEPNECIVIVGKNPLSFAKMKRHNNIIFIPRTNSCEELVAIYRDVDVMFGASQEEALDMANLEAQVCGTPVVGFLSTAVPETIDPNQNGALAPSGDWLEALKQIRKINNSGKTFYAAACRRRTEMLYSKKIIINQYLDLYRN